jgi:PAS domain S-box-containing protein
MGCIFEVGAAGQDVMDTRAPPARGPWARVVDLRQHAVLRYLLAVVAVAAAFGLRIWLVPFTGTGAPFVLFFAAALTTSLFAGVGPAILAMVLSLPLAAGVFVLGALDGHYLNVNAALCRLLGRSAEEMLRTSFPEITHPDDRQQDAVQTAQLLRGELQRIERAKRYLRTDGTLLDVVVNVALVRDAGGGPRYFISQVEDVTERKRAEEALRLSEATSAGIIAVSADAIISVDEQQNVCLFNRGAEEIFGYPAAEVLGRPHELLLPERFRSHPPRAAAPGRGGDGAGLLAGLPGDPVQHRPAGGEEHLRPLHHRPPR